MPDPKYQGSDIRIARRIARKHGPDIERRRIRAEQFLSRVQTATRRTVKKRSAAQAEMEQLRRQIASSFEAQLEREQRVLSDWAQRQLSRMQDRLLSSVSPEDIASIERAQRKYNSFAELIKDLEG